MVRERHAFPFRWVLPITQLVLCVVVLWPLRATLIQQIRDSVRAYRPLKTPPSRPSANQQIRILVLDAVNPQQQRALQALERREWTPMMLDLPSGLMQLPYVILNPAKKEWIPRDMDFKTWRAISWPLLGMLFWWGAGRGIEALLATRQHLVHPRIGWIETIVGAALFMFCAVAAVCLPLYGRVGEDFPVKLWVAGSGTWAVLGRVMVAARVAQWRIRRRAGPSNVTEAFQT